MIACPAYLLDSSSYMPSGYDIHVQHLFLDIPSQRAYNILLVSIHVHMDHLDLD